MAKRNQRNSARREVLPSLAGLQLFPLPGIPEVQQGDDLCQHILSGAQRAGVRFENGDILVVAQKIVSKAEGAAVRLASVKPSSKARSIGKKLKKDPRMIEVVLRESRRIVRSDRVLIVETRHGLVCANAGVDHSNVSGDDAVTLLPRDPDRSAKKIAAALQQRTGKRLGIIISDSFGRPWRMGLTNVAIGAAGVPVLRDLRGTRDRQGKPLTATVLAVADELAGAAGLVMGKSEGFPVVVIRGYHFIWSNEPAARLIRSAEEDLFR
jgi:coenzyme F420-0:L-glutamate ligase / coenzyme F420-1:gamma-L-glutamate ligase